METTVKSVDTLLIYERLKKAKTSEAKAREMAEILRELVEGQVATKNDLEKIKLELQTEIEKSKNSAIKWIIGWVTGLILTQTGILVALR